MIFIQNKTTQAAIQQPEVIKPATFGCHSKKKYFSVKSYRL